MKNRIYTFKSGYTVGVLPTYNEAILNLAVQGWIAENPIPEAPIQTVKAKGGATREIRVTNDPNYQDQLMIWQSLQENYRATAKMRLAIDPDSIDKNVITQARQKMESFGLKAETDDVKFYLSLVADPGNGRPGDGDYRPAEMPLLNDFIDEKKGPSGALIEHLLRTTFRNQNPEPANTGISGHLGSATEAQSQAGDDTSGEADPDTSG